jgi:hypothetical protein
MTIDNIPFTGLGFEFTINNNRQNDHNRRQDIITNKLLVEKWWLDITRWIGCGRRYPL